MKKTILIEAIGGTGWIGGIYYKKNIVFSLLQNSNISKKYRIVVFTNRENENVFDDLPEITIKCINSKRWLSAKLLSFCVLNRVKYLFSRNADKLKLIGITTISWIPDFQHNHYPENFSNDNLNMLNTYYSKIANSKSPLVLSSNNCKDDFEKYYSSNKKNVYVVPFVSAIESMLIKLNEGYCKDVLKKYSIVGKYICIMNQFWKHKNHKIVFQALKQIAQKYQNEVFEIVCTGSMDDYRNPEYINELKTILSEEKIKNKVRVLGFIDRLEQLALMKNAEFIIQPSLFEGWGTVVEDAKVLDKTILLSDIPVHREQMNEKCILFDPHNPKELADLIQQECYKEHHDNIEKGITDMKKMALEYSKGFEQLLRDQEKSR